MIDSKNHRTKSVRLKKIKNTINGDISPIINGQKLSNGNIYHKSEEIDLNESWNVMTYEDYVRYRSYEEKSLSDSFFGNSLYDFTWDLVKEIHNRRHSTSGKEGCTQLSSTSEKEGGSSPGFIFKFYKKFGFYWNVFPKTDYCYLPGSPDYKKEVSPGIPKVPNLSRYPLSSFVDRSTGVRSRVVNKYDSSAYQSRQDINLSDSSTKSHSSSSQNFSLTKGYENVEARQNIINNILSREQKQRGAWATIKRFIHTSVTTVKRMVVMTFTTVKGAASSASNLRIPLLLLFILLLPFLYYFIPGFAQEHKTVESMNEESTLMRFISLVAGYLISFLSLVKDSFLFIPTICQQLLAFLLTFYNTETSIQNDAVSIKTHEKVSVPLFPVVRNVSQELTKEQLITLQSGIIEKIKNEMAGKENIMSKRIDRLQDQMKQLTEDIKKMSGSIEADWRSRFTQLEEEIKLELEDIKKSVDDFGEKSVGGLLVSPTKLVEKAVAKYHADRTGKPDYALQSSGGYVVRVRCTQMYTKTTGTFYLLGLPMPWDISNGPDTIIKPGVMPGECWAFEGSYAQVALRLAAKVKVTSFSIEHSPRELALHGHISSAPKQFSVWALDSEEDENPVLLGRFSFLDNSESLQEFEALEYDKAVDLIELKVESNHGHPDYTCLYRFRVHGVPPPIQENAVNNTVQQNQDSSIPH